jgi:SAM-dependent methyltransferase
MDMYPTDPVETLRRSSDIDIARELIAPASKRILDIGCGEGDLTRALAGDGAEVTGIDPHEGRIERARAKAAEDGLTVAFETGIGESLPYPNASFDVAVLSNSLHHVPEDRMAATVTEAARVVAPGGLLYAMEPVPRGPYFDVQSVWNDETANRVKALEAVAAVEAIGFAPVAEVFYLSARRSDSCDDYIARAASRHESRRDDIARLTPQIAQKFDANAVPVNGGFDLDMVFRVNLFRKAEPAG